MKKHWIVLLVGLFLINLSGCQMTGSMGGGLFMMPASDSSLTTRVQSALYSNDDPLIANIRAESIGGTVVLTGYVKKIRQSDEAESIARQVPGVRQVENRIIVRQ